MLRIIRRRRHAASAGWPRRPKAVADKKLYLAKQKKFDARRKKVRLSFAELHLLFARDDISMAAIAERCGISRSRIARIYKLHFAQIFGRSGLARREKREARLQDQTRQRLMQSSESDEVLEAIRRSARKAGRARRIEPIVSDKKSPSNAIRSKAVLVNGQAESLHHIQNRKLSRSGRQAYGITTLHRSVLTRYSHSIFCIHVPGYARRVIRCDNSELRKALFDRAAEQVGIYIPLVQRPESTRYDFLADEDNWS